MKPRFFAPAAVLLALVLIVSGGPQRAAAVQTPPFVPDEVLVGLRPGADEGLAVARLSAAAGRVVGRQARLRAYRLKLAPGLSLQAGIARLSRLGEVAYAEPNPVVHAVGAPSDPYYATSQYAPQKIQADLAWSLWQPQAAVVVAIVDTGIQHTHPDLTDKIYRDAAGVIGYNAFTGQRSDAMDDHGHGTHCAGIAAARINNGTGVAGIAGWTGDSTTSDAVYTKLMPVKVLDSTGSGSDATVADGVVWAADHGAKVISLSLGSPYSSTTLTNAVDYAWNKGCVVLAAAGNNGSSSPFYPAACERAIAVAATDSTDTLTSYSNWGSWVDVAAPGHSILATYPGGYAHMSGTSMACPHVAGEAALLLAQAPGLSNSQVSSLVRENVDPYTPYSGRTLASGAGRINAYRALQAAGTAPAPSEPAPPPAETAPAAPTNLSASRAKRKVNLSWTQSTSAGVVQNRVYRSQTGGGPYSLLATLNSATSYSDTQVRSGVTYYYRVTAVSSGGLESSYSNEAAATPR